MKLKNNNKFFLYVVLIVTVGQFSLASTLRTWGLAELVPYLVCLFLGVKMLKKDGTPFMEALPYDKGMKPLTALFSVLLVFTLSPLSTLLATIGSAIGGDMLTVFQEAIFGRAQSFPEQLFEIAVIPAVFEEMLFRGFFYDGFKRAGSTRCAILFSSLLFGFFHMNIQQIMYAAVLGVVLALLREMSGSMWPGMLMHFVNNGWSTVLMSVPEESVLLKLPIERVTFTGTAGETVYASVMVIVCTALSVLLLYLIAKQEGCTEQLRKFYPLKEGETKEKLFTKPLIIACAILVVFTGLMTLAMLLSKNPAFLQMLSEYAGS